MDLISISRELLEQKLNSKQRYDETLVKQDSYYAVAGKGTSKEDWSAHKHEAYIIDNGLCLFLNKDEAKQFAELHDVPDMIIALSRRSASALIKEYTDRGCITHVRVYAVLPAFTVIMPKEFQHKEKEQEQINKPGEKLSIDPAVTERAKKILDMANPSERAQMDSCGSFKNLHAAIDRLLRDSKTSPDALDKALGLPDGMTARFCSELVDNKVPLRVAKQYLEVFGLEAYIYQFKNECAEIASELGASQVDAHQIKPASIHAKEPFVLKSVRRGKDANGAYVYQLVFSGEHRNVTELVSSPLGYIQDKKYTIIGLEDLSEAEESLSSQKAVSDDKAQSVMNELTEKYHITEKKEPPTHEEQRKNDIIRYMKANLGFSAKDAEAKLASIYWEEDLLEEFWNYVKNHKTPKIRIRGYTAMMLMKELHFTPIEAYQQMIGLRKKPRETEQMLKYRRTDPQYQK